jgi:hypothetical protein
MNSYYSRVKNNLNKPHHPRSVKKNPQDYKVLSSKDNSKEQVHPKFNFLIEMSGKINPKEKIMDSSTINKF